MTPPGLYRHYKGGLYAVLATVRDSTYSREGTPMVLYYSLKLKKLNVRNEDEFNEIITRDDGQFRPRFEQINDQTSAANTTGESNGQT